MAATPNTSAKLVDASQATTCPDKPITRIVVDPGTEDTFVMDVEAARAASVQAEPNTRHVRPEDKDRVADLLKQARVTGTPIAALSNAARVGTPAPTVDGGNHNHPAAPLPANVVAPPQYRVHFDIPGYAAMSFRYHAVKRVPGFLVLITDTRYGGTADFYPYASRVAREKDQPMGAYVDKGKKLYLLKPKSIVFRHDPFEFCLVPIAEEKPLPTDLSEAGEVDLVGEYRELEQPTEGHNHGEARDHRGGGDAPRADPRAAPPDDAPIADRLDLRVGGKGGVL